MRLPRRAVAAVIVYRVAGYRALGSAGTIAAAVLARRHPAPRRHPWGKNVTRVPWRKKLARVPPPAGEPAAARGSHKRASRPHPALAAAAARRPGWRRYAQLVPVAILLWALDAADRFRAGVQAAGLAHAVDIDRISDRIGGTAALVMNRWLAVHPLPAGAAAAYYMVLQVVVTGITGVFLLRSGIASFRLHRDALIVTGVIGLVVFWLFPVAPPRMLPGYHDIAAATVPFFSSMLESKAADQFAAFPSLHVTWALWAAIALRALLRRPLWRILVWAYPALTALDVLATANHYMLDVIAAPAVLLLGYVAAAALGHATAAAHPALARRTRHARPATVMSHSGRPATRDEAFGDAERELTGR